MRSKTLFLPHLDYPPLTSFEALRTHENGLYELVSVCCTPRKNYFFLYIKKNIKTHLNALIRWNAVPS